MRGEEDRPMEGHGRRFIAWRVGGKSGAAAGDMVTVEVQAQAKSPSGSTVGVMGLSSPILEEIFVMFVSIQKYKWWLV